MSGHLHTGLLHFHHPALHRVLGQLGRAHGVGVALLDLLAHLIEARRVGGGGHGIHGTQRLGDLLLHLGLLQLAQKFGSLTDLLLQRQCALLDGLLRLLRGLQCLVVLDLEVLDALLSRHQLSREGFGGVGVLGGLRDVAGRRGLVGEGQRLTHVGLQLLDIGELTVQPHLELTLCADDLSRLLGQALVTTLLLLDGLLDLDLGIGVLVHLGAEQRHQVLPRLHERIGHLVARLQVEYRMGSHAGCVGAQFIGSPPKPTPGMTVGS